MTPLRAIHSIEMSEFVRTVRNIVTWSQDSHVVVVETEKLELRKLKLLQRRRCCLH